LRTEEECLSRKVLVRGSFKAGREYYIDDAKEHEGKNECGKKRDKEHGLNVIDMQLDPGKGETTTRRRARTMAAAFSPGSNGTKSVMACVACAPDVLIAGLKTGFVN
jgi:hypothetical protein